MSDDTNARLDPRFDPAFQRGFDQSVPSRDFVVPAKASSAPHAPAVVVPPEPVAPVDGEVVADVVEAQDVAASPSRNPFLLFLGIISIALVAVGIWLFVRSGDAFNSTQVRTQGDYLSLDATIHAAPFIAMLGAATAIGILFVFAARWHRR